MIFPKGSQELIDMGMDDELPSPPPIGPNEVRCTFCKRGVNPINATVGTGRPRPVVDDDIRIENGRVEVLDRVYYVADKVTACPDCALRVEKIKWPQSRG